MINPSPISFSLSCLSKLRTPEGLAQKWNAGKRQANTGSAGALARNERAARNSYSVKKFELERAAHAPAGEGARALSTNRLVPDRIDFLGRATLEGNATS